MNLLYYPIIKGTDFPTGCGRWVVFVSNSPNVWSSVQRVASEITTSPHILTSKSSKFCSCRATWRKFVFLPAAEKEVLKVPRGAETCVLPGWGVPQVSKGEENQALQCRCPLFPHIWSPYILRGWKWGSSPNSRTGRRQSHSIVSQLMSAFLYAW